MKNTSFDEAVYIAKKVCVEDIKVIIGIGGGRVLDTAKYAAHISKAVYICMPTSDMFADIWDKARTVRADRITILDDVKPDRIHLDEIYNRMVKRK